MRKTETPGMFNTGPMDKAPHPGSRRHDPETSSEAARKVDVTGLQKVLLRELSQAPLGLTTAEIARNAGIDVVSISPRTGPLEDKGLIRDTGKTRIPAGKTRHGKIWEITPTGVYWYRNCSHQPDSDQVQEKRHLATLKARRASIEADTRMYIEQMDCSDAHRRTALDQLTVLMVTLNPETKQEPPQ